MKQVSTDSKLIAITTRYGQAYNIIEGVLGENLPRITTLGVNTYFVLCEETQVNLFNTLDMVLPYEGQIHISDTQHDYKKLQNGSFDNMTPTPQTDIDILLKLLCGIERKQITETLSVKVGSADGIKIDLKKIQLPMRQTKIKKGSFLDQKIKALDSIKDAKLTYGTVPYTDRHRVLLSIIKGLIIKGFSKNEIMDIMEEHNLILSDKPEYQADKIYDIVYEKTLNGGNMQHLHELYGRVRLNNNTDTRVWNAILSEAVQQNKLNPSITMVSLRRLSTTVGWEAVNSSIARLIQYGLITRTFEYNKTNSNMFWKEYTFHITPSITTTQVKGMSINNDIVFSKQYYSSIEQESALHKGLGKGYDIIITLLGGKYSDKELAEKTGFTLDTTRRYLKILVSKKYIVKSKQGRTAYYELSKNSDNHFYIVYVEEMVKVVKRIKAEMKSLDESNKQRLTIK